MTERSNKWTDVGPALDAIEEQSGGVFTVELLHRGMAEEQSHDFDRVRVAVMQNVKDTFSSFHRAPGSRRDA